MNIIDIAITCHEVNKAYCEGIGDNSQVSWNNAEQWQRDSAIKGVQFNLDNPNSTPADTHQNWCKDKIADGWKYGTVKDPIKKEHHCLLPYDQLPVEQRTKDGLFQAVVKSLLPCVEPEEDLESEEITKEVPEAIPTFGENLVGITFNPDENKTVAKLKGKFSDIANIVNDHNESKDKNQNTQRLFSHSISLVLDAQMNCVKGLFYKG